MTLPDELTDEVRRAVRSLVGARLDPARWDDVRTELRALGSVVVVGEVEAVRARLTPVAQAGFEGTVRRRLGSTRGSAPAVVPTKRTSGLPIIGAICAAMILALGWVLGGGLVLAGTAALALGVLGVALAGTRANLARMERARAERSGRADTTVATPADVLSLIGEIERALD